MYHLYVTTDIYRICQIFVARFRIWGGLSNALGRISLQKPPRGAGADITMSIFDRSTAAYSDLFALINPVYRVIQKSGHLYCFSGVRFFGPPCIGNTFVIIILVIDV